VKAKKGTRTERMKRKGKTDMDEPNNHEGRENQFEDWARGKGGREGASRKTSSWSCCCIQAGNVVAMNVLTSREVLFDDDDDEGVKEGFPWKGLCGGCVEKTRRGGSPVWAGGVRKEEGRSKSE